MDKETSEIAKLTGRIAQDPKSKLFVPLAEEYKKAGDLDMAIQVLLEGLKNNPTYITARSSLGKLLIAKGDLAGAQKEFEEVVRSSPDNFMARKKLGDLAILQNSPQDALQHYKIALSLNPNDGELDSLISDIQADRDVSSKIHLTTANSATAEQVVNQHLSSLASPEPGSEPPAPESNVAHISRISDQSVSPAAPPELFEESIGAVDSSITENEEPEEVLVVEPLELETFEPEPFVAVIDLPEEQAPETGPPAAAEEIPDNDVTAQSHAQDESVVSDDIGFETDLFKVEDVETSQTAVAEETAAEEAVDAAIGGEIAEEFPAETINEVAAKSDDFTTDTLAELYITQGFYEKAVEIYDRMLADNPNSQGLKDKLAWVRAAAAQSGTLSAGQNKEPDIHDVYAVEESGPIAEAGIRVDEPSSFDAMGGTRLRQERGTGSLMPGVVPEEREDVQTVVPEEITINNGDFAEPEKQEPGEPSPVQDLVTESNENLPAWETRERSTTGEPAKFDGMSAIPEVQKKDQPTPQPSDFEPREYVPPRMDEESLKSADEQAQSAAHTDIPRRKETIARLETWLTNIKKER
jgi:tetratricopeptide (TPR) repeat protein